MTRTQLDILKQAIPEFIINLKKYGTTSKALEALKRTFKSNNITIQDWNLVLEVVGQQSDIFNALSDVTSLEETLVTVLEKITNALEETQTDLATLDSNKADKDYVDSENAAQVTEYYGFYDANRARISTLEGKVPNYDAHITTTSGNPHNVTKYDIGLENVDNTKDINKPVSTAQQTAINNAVARANLVSILGEASQSLNGLMSSTDKTRLDTLFELLGETADANAVVDTINEVLAIFDQYPEGASIVAALAGKQETLVSGTNIKTINNQSLLGSGNIDSDIVINFLEEITWSALKTKRDSSQLVPGKLYRITDYVCTTTYPATSAASHQFDIIVRAIDVNKLDENARAAVHNGDTYFNPASGYKPKLSAWELKYCLDNDTNRFGWADSTNGKGVIYWMKDEFNNECPYDFKNILFTNGSSYLNAYTFSYTENSTIKDASLLTSKKCCGNVMKEFYYLNKIQLNFNVFYSTSTIFDCSHNTFGNDCRFNTFGTSCYNNTFGNDCYNNTFGNNCYNNTFGNDCYNNTFGNNCYHNIFGNECNSNTFDNMCHHNAFGNHCYTNTFGTECPYNTFGNHCYSNTFGKNCYSNTFGNECYHNIFGIYCSYNTFGDDCFYNTFGTSSSAINFCKHIIFDNGCSYIYLFSDDIAASRSNRLQNVHIHLGVVGSSDQNRLSIVVPDRALPYSIDYYKDNSQEVYL